MAAIDFPSTPTLNQVVLRGGYTWQWSGTVWNKVVAGGLPSATNTGDLLQWNSGTWESGSQASVIGDYVSSQVDTKASTGKAIAMAIVFGG